MRIAVLVLVAGCGSVPASLDAGDATTTDDAPQLAFGDASSTDDAPYVGPDIVLDAGGPFLCHGCVCDGRDHYCYDLWTGALTGDAAHEAAACSTDGGSHCVPYPQDCLPTPSCECVLGHNCPSAQCVLDPSASGLDVLCILP